MPWFKTTTNVAYGVNLHPLETTASSDTQITSTDYYINEGLGPNQPTSEKEYSYTFTGPDTHRSLYYIRTYPQHYNFGKCMVVMINSFIILIVTLWYSDDAQLFG